MSPRSAPIKVLANASELVDVLAAESPLTLAEAAERIGIPRSSAYRLIDGLADVDLVESMPDGRVRLSARWLRLADAARAGMSEWSDTAPVLEALVSRTGQTSFLSLLSDGGTVCIDWRPGRGVDVLPTKPGQTLPLNAGASGRVILAWADESDDLLAEGVFPALTPRSMTTVEALRADIVTTRDRGYCFSDGDLSVGIAGLGVPILDDAGHLAATVSVAGLGHVFHEKIDEFVEIIREETASLQGRRRL